MNGGPAQTSICLHMVAVIYLAVMASTYIAATGSSMTRCDRRWPAPSPDGHAASGLRPGPSGAAGDIGQRVFHPTPARRRRADPAAMRMAAGPAPPGLRPGHLRQ